MIEITNLHKKFADKEVLKGINLSINEGKVFAIIGPSGTGKSTLLRCINTLEIADAGQIKLNGYSADFANLSKKDMQMLRTRTSMVFQNSNLFRNKTAHENIMEPLITVKKMNREEASKIALDLLDRVGLSNKKTAYPETLSGGEKQRVGIARAMAVNSDIILFDEPTSALDPELVNEVLDVIKSLAKQKITMLIVTHEMKFAREVADEIIFMENGTVVEQTPANIFFTNPKMERSRIFINMQSDDISKLDFSIPTNRRFTASLKWADLNDAGADPDLYPMWIADMEFKSPHSIIRRINDRANEGILGYDILSDSYYESIVDWMKKRHSYEVEKEDIVYCSTAMTGLSIFLQAFTDVGDEILVNSPVYKGFFTTIKGCGRKAVESHLHLRDNRFSFDIEDMESKITPNTKILLVCNPQNPTGTVWTTREIEELCRFCNRYNLILVSDELHHDLILGNTKHTVAAKIAEEMSIPSVTLISPGKSFNVSGIHPAAIIIKNKLMREKFVEGMGNLEYPFPNSLVEPVTIGAYKESEEWLNKLTDYIDENQKLFDGFIENRIPCLKVVKREATYLVWVDCRGLKLSNDSLEKFWREKCKLILSDGKEYGSDYEQYRRFNIACPKQKLIEILER